MWSLNFLVEVAVKFGVLLTVPRNKARRIPRNPTSCTVLASAIDAQKIIQTKNGRFKKFKATCSLLHPLHIRLDLYLWPSISPKKKFKNEHMLQGFFPGNILCHFGVKGASPLRSGHKI